MAVGDPSSNPPSTEILDLFPTQGEWQDGDYFALPGNRIVELVQGHVEVLPVPSLLHQFLVRLIFLQLNEVAEREGLGIVMTAPTRVRIDDRHYREPDVLFVLNEHMQRRHEQYWETIDLAVEIISPDDPDRDLIDKRNDYAAAGVSEYWIIDPRDDSVTVLGLDGTGYDVLARASHGHVSSKLVPGFEVDVKQLFAEARRRT